MATKKFMKKYIEEKQVLGSTPTPPPPPCSGCCQQGPTAPADEVSPSCTTSPPHDPTSSIILTDCHQHPPPIKEETIEIGDSDNEEPLKLCPPYQVNYPPEYQQVQQVIPLQVIPFPFPVVFTLHQPNPIPHPVNPHGIRIDYDRYTHQQQQQQRVPIYKEGRNFVHQPNPIRSSETCPQPITDHKSESENHDIRDIPNEAHDKNLHKNEDQHNPEEERLGKDERKAKDMGIDTHISVSDIIHLPMDEFNERLANSQMDDVQQTECRDIRRRGKNKVAAQNCRKRKNTEIEESKSKKTEFSNYLEGRGKALSELEKELQFWNEEYHKLEMDIIKQQDLDHKVFTIIFEKEKIKFGKRENGYQRENGDQNVRRMEEASKKYRLSGEATLSKVTHSFQDSANIHFKMNNQIHNDKHQQTPSLNENLRNIRRQPRRDNLEKKPRRETIIVSSSISTTHEKMYPQSLTTKHSLDRTSVSQSRPQKSSGLSPGIGDMAIRSFKPPYKTDLL